MGEDLSIVELTALILFEGQLVALFEGEPFVVAEFLEIGQ